MSDQPVGSDGPEAKFALGQIVAPRSAHFNSKRGNPARPVPARSGRLGTLDPHDLNANENALNMAGVCSRRINRHGTSNFGLSQNGIVRNDRALTGGLLMTHG